MFSTCTSTARPSPAKIVCVTYKKGQFLVASKEAASDANEQNILTVEGVIGGRRTRVVFNRSPG